MTETILDNEKLTLLDAIVNESFTEARLILKRIVELPTPFSERYIAVHETESHLEARVESDTENEELKDFLFFVRELKNELGSNDEENEEILNELFNGE